MVIYPELEVLSLELARVEHEVRAQGALYAEGPLPRPRRDVRRNSRRLVEVHRDVPPVFYYLLEPLLVIGECSREIRFEPRGYREVFRFRRERLHSDHEVPELEPVPYLRVPDRDVVHPSVGQVHVHAPVIALRRELEPHRIENELPAAERLLELDDLEVDPDPPERERPLEEVRVRKLERLAFGRRYRELPPVLERARYRVNQPELRVLDENPGGVGHVCRDMGGRRVLLDEPFGELLHRPSERDA